MGVLVCIGDGIGVAVGNDVKVTVAIGTDGGEKIFFATVSPNNADAIVHDKSTNEIKSHCQPARIRACRVL